MTLEQAYKDGLLLIAFLGLIGVSIFALYGYLTVHDPRLLAFAVIVMLLGVLIRIARAVFTVEFWRAIFKNWKK